MKDDIVRFRKLCSIMLGYPDMSINKISVSSGISFYILKKLLDDPLDEIRIKASVLGLVQDHLHKNANVLLSGEVDDVLIKKVVTEDVPEDVPGKKVVTDHSGPMSIEGANAYIKQGGNGNVSEVIGDVVTQKRMGMALDDPLRKDTADNVKDNGQDKDIDKDMDRDNLIGTKNLVQIVLFLRMEATRHRQIAHDYELSADQLAKMNLEENS